MKVEILYFDGCPTYKATENDRPFLKWRRPLYVL
jgi:hypothetical protein